MSSNLKPGVDFDMDGGEAVQIVAIENGRFVLNEQNLRGILMNPNVKNQRVFVISICGAYRTGKSFLMSSFLNYLKPNHNNSRLNSGFRWSYGSSPYTKGIWMWNKPIDVTIENGKNVKYRIF